MPRALGIISHEQALRLRDKLPKKVVIISAEQRTRMNQVIEQEHEARKRIKNPDTFEGMKKVQEITRNIIKAFGEILHS